MSLLAVLFAFASLVWMIPIARSGRLLLLAMAILGIGTVFGPNFFAVDGPIQLSLDRMMYFGMFALAVVGLRFGITRLPKMTRVDWLVVAIVGWFGLSAMTGGGDPPGTPPPARWLFYIAMPAGMYFVARLMDLKSDDVRWLILGATGLGMYLSITALLEIKGIHGAVFPRYIVDAEVWEFYGRGRGPLMNPSGHGFLISIGLAAAAVGLVGTSRDRRPIYLLLVLCLFMGVYATLTRSAWMGGFAAVAIIGFLLSPRWVRVFGLCVALLMAGLATTSVKDQLFRMKRDQNLTAADAEKSVKLRPLLATVAWEMFKDRPIVGHGFGHYFAKHKPYHDARGYDMPLGQARPYAQHNVFLSVLVDTGLIGFTLFLSWFVAISAGAWRMARDNIAGGDRRAVGLLMLGTIAAYFCNGMFQDTMIIPMVHMFLFFVAGVAATAMQTGVASGTQPQRAPCRAADLPAVTN